MRDAGDPPFAEDDTRLLAELAPLLGALLRRGVVGADAAESGDAPPPGTLILDDELQPAGWTPAFRDWLAELPGSGGLPPAVFEIATRALAPVGLPNRVRIRTAAGRWAVLEGAPLEGAGSGRVAITARAAGAEEVFDVLCRAHALSPRERQLAALLLHGLSTEQLASALFISAFTVKDHLKAIFAKTGVRSRRELISHLTGRQSAAVSPPST
jgi:DNA-binding CsgD family transcriptional regulator